VLSLYKQKFVTFIVFCGPAEGEDRIAPPFDTAVQIEAVVILEPANNVVQGRRNYMTSRKEKPVRFAK
jgi:hypothetical protein